MELDILKTQTTWNDASASINNNFAKVKTALEQGGGTGGGSIDVDTEMSDTSENAVQNKVIKAYVDAEAERVVEYAEGVANDAEAAAKKYTDEKIKNSGGGGEKEVYRVYENGTLDEEKEANTLAYQAAQSGKDCTFYLEAYYNRIEASTVLVTDSYVELRFLTAQYTRVGEKLTDAIHHEGRIVSLTDNGDGIINTYTTYTPSLYAVDKAYIDNLGDAKQDTLISGTNIKTINGHPVLGEGNIEIEGGAQIAVDNKLSSISENPVQNKVIYAELIERFEGIDELLDAINGEEI